MKNIPSRLLYARQVRDKEYKVRKGDTALSIARKYKVSLQELVQANDLGKKAKVRLGQTLRIPIPASASASVVAVKSVSASSSKAMVTLEATPKEEVMAKVEQPIQKEAKKSKAKEVSPSLADSGNTVLTLNKLSKRTP
ncbi:MAG: LysM domain-containing protein [Candidatus Electrothrix sp. LOE2]|nr:LysM domain-containing protein [Candidatus Electrothrix sp. LOE2]